MNKTLEMPRRKNSILPEDTRQTSNGLASVRKGHRDVCVQHKEHCLEQLEPPNIKIVNIQSLNVVFFVVTLISGSFLIYKPPHIIFKSVSFSVAIKQLFFLSRINFIALAKSRKTNHPAPVSCH